MKKLAIFLLICAPVLAQLPLPNISYTANLNGSCSTANGACSNGLFLTGTSAYGTTGSAFILGSGSTLDIAVAHYNAATITVSGTYSNLTINFDFADPTGGGGTNYFQEICARTDVNVLESTEAVTNNATRAWQCPVWAATRFRVRNSNASLTGAPLVTIILTTAAIDPSLIVAASPPVVPGSTDPCQDLSQQKQSVPISIAATAGTVQLVAISGTTAVYVCGFSAQITAGTTPTIQFEYGTGTTCGTGTTTLTGTYAPGAGTAPATDPISFSGGYTIFKAPAGNAFCIVAGGTTPSVGGFVTFVQQ